MDKQLKKYLKSKDFTGFQKKVLLAVSKIPKGEVRSYKWVAKRIGHPKSFRAVGQALKRNPLPIRIPCHRVVRSDYKLGGFAFGKRAKERLLSKEGLTVKKDTVIIERKDQVPHPVWNLGKRGREGKDVGRDTRTFR